MINTEELVFAVDENNNPIEPVTRTYAHDHGIWHRISHVWIINNKKEVLCQKRTLQKDSNPGKWEPFFGGHVLAGQSYIDAAVQEVHEEIGLQLSEKDLVQLGVYKSLRGYKVPAAFYTFWDGDIASLIPEKSEIDEIVWKSLEDLTNVLLVQNDPTWVHVVYEKEILQKIKNL